MNALNAVLALLDSLDAAAADQTWLFRAAPCSRCRAKASAPCVSPGGSPLSNRETSTERWHAPRQDKAIRTLHGALLPVHREDLVVYRDPPAKVLRRLRASALYRAAVRDGLVVADTGSKRPVPRPVSAFSHTPVCSDTGAQVDTGCAHIGDASSVDTVLLLASSEIPVPTRVSVSEAQNVRDTADTGSERPVSERRAEAPQPAPGCNDSLPYSPSTPTPEPLPVLTPATQPAGAQARQSLLGEEGVVGFWFPADRRPR